MVTGSVSSTSIVGCSREAAEVEAVDGRQGAATAGKGGAVDGKEGADVAGKVGGREGAGKVGADVREYLPTIGITLKSVLYKYVVQVTSL